MWCSARVNGPVGKSSASFATELAEDCDPGHRRKFVGLALLSTLT